MKKILISPSITDREVHSLNLYLNELSKIPVLTREEETILFKEYKMGDLKAKDKLITHNLRFVVSVAKHYQNMGVLLEDLIAEGNFGLMR
jgi:RNA polymerase primary sigma factor